MKYKEFIEELTSLLGRANLLFSAPRLKDSQDFKRWKKELEMLFIAIEEEGYQIQCGVISRDFSVFSPYGPTPTAQHRTEAFNNDLQETIHEMEILINNFHKFGEPSRAGSNGTSIKKSQERNDDDNLAHLIISLSWRGRVYFVGLLFIVLSGGINLARVSAVRELFQISLEQEVVVREVAIPSARNEELDRKIEGWIEGNETRIAELHAELLQVENEAQTWTSYPERQRAYSELALRLKDSIAKENEAFSRNLASLRAGAN